MFLSSWITGKLISRFGSGAFVLFAGNALGWIILVAVLFGIGSLFGYCGSGGGDNAAEVQRLREQLEDDRETFKTSEAKLKAEISVAKKEAEELEGRVAVWKGNYAEAKTALDLARQSTDNALRRVDMLETVIKKNVPPQVADRARCEAFPNSDGCK